MVYSDFIKLYEELSNINDSCLNESNVENIDLSKCRVITTDVKDTRGEFETNSCLEYNGELTRLQVRTIIIRNTENGKEFLARKSRYGMLLPGGGYDKIKDNGNILETARREALEEFNFILTELDDTGVRTWKHREDSWVEQHVKNPEDRWTGYYSFFIVGQLDGSGNNKNPDETFRWHWYPLEQLTKVHPDLESIVEIYNSDIDEAFDNEAAYGEGARTIPGVLRYFTADIATLNLILDSCKIKASDRLEPDPTVQKQKPVRGRTGYKERPFVSFSKQLFSHAYRNPRKWRYGIAVSQPKLETATPHLDKATEFTHTGSKSQLCVYGAVRLKNGVEIIITSYGTYRISLTKDQMNILGLESGSFKNSFYDEIKQVFDVSNKKYYTDKTRLKNAVNIPIEAEIEEGFITGFDNHAVALNGKKVYKHVPELWDFLHTHTPIDEGEYRVWLEDNQEFLDISSCIHGVVLPSNYQEENEQHHIDKLHSFIDKHNLEVYQYDATKVPWSRQRGRGDCSTGRANTMSSIEGFFEKITSSKEEAIKFIKTFATSKQTRVDYSVIYNSRVCKSTTATNVGEVSKNKECNYRAFLNAISKFGITSKEVGNIVTAEKEAQQNNNIEEE